MNERSDIIENYLDELLAGLVGDAGAVRRMLTETETHLYSDVDQAVARGVEHDEAARAAVAQFGPADRVTAMWNATAPPKPLPPPGDARPIRSRGRDAPGATAT